MRRPPSHKPRPRRDRGRVLAPLLIVAAFLTATPAGAQRFGQWWWDGSVGVAQRSFDNSVDDTKTSSYEQQDLKLTLGLHGYVLHPALASFDLGTDFSLSQIEGGRGLDNDQLGLRAALHLIPRGTYPTRVYFSRQSYDYGNLSEEDPFTLAAVPDLSTTWGFRNRIRRGPVRGLITGLESSSIDFLDPELDAEKHDRQFLQWDRTFGAFQHHVRLEHRVRSYSAVDLEIENTTLTVDDRAILGDVWRWEMSALGIQRTITVPGSVAGLGVDDYRIRNQLTRPVRDTDHLDIQYQIAAVRPEGADDSLGHDLRLVYRWQPRPSVELAPFVQYFRQAFDSRTIESPRVGLSATWRGSLSTIDVLAGGRTSFGQSTTDGESEKSDQTEVAYGGSLTLSHGESTRLRKELEVDFSRDDFRVDSSPVVDVPDLGLPLAGALVRDSERARFTLETKLLGVSATAWSEWQRREIRTDLDDGSVESESFSTTLQISGQRWSILGNTGQLTARRETMEDQTVDFIGTAVSWRPFRFLEIHGSYRTDTRELTLTPDLKGESWQAGTRFHLGRLSFEAVAFETTETLMDGPERRNEGLRVSITRRFAGWLPIVTAPERRGVIR